MTEQQACTLCGADGHRAYACPMRVEEHPPVLVPWSVLDRAVMWVEDRRRYGDDGTIVDDWLALKTIQRAALAQPSPAPELWAVHAQGPDDLYAAFSRDDAEKHAAELNALPMPEGITVGAVVVPSPWPAIEHWKYLAEQEREHNASLVAQAGQVPDSTASAKALVEIEAKKYSLNAAGMFNSGAPDHRQTIAVQELLADFDDDEAEGHWEAIMAYSDLRASDALFHAAELLAAAPAQGDE